MRILFPNDPINFQFNHQQCKLIYRTIWLRSHNSIRKSYILSLILQIVVFIWEKKGSNIYEKTEIL